MRHRALLLATALLLIVAAAASAARVSAAHGAARRALVNAFVHQDGTSVGISAVYLSGGNGVVCLKTPDAGLVRFLFHHSGSSWHFAFSTKGTRSGSGTQRKLEAAC